MTTPPRVRLNVLELEARDVPAWWSVTAPDPAAGSIGSTDATHTGELTLNPGYDAVGGVVTVWADTAAQAVAEVLTGSIEVTLGDEVFEQVFGPDTVGTAADGKVFAVAITGAGGTIALEDMVGFPGATPDMDYDDRSFAPG